MKKKVDLNRIFLLFLLGGMMVQTIRLLPFRPLYQIFPYFVLILFGIIFLKDFFNGKYMWKSYKIILLIIFLAIYFVSSCINYKYAFIDNIQLIFWMCVQFFAVYSFDKRKEKKYYIRTLEIVAKFFIAFTFIAAVASLITYFFNINGILDYGYIEFRYGFRNNRLFGVHGSPNYGALFSVVSIIFTAYFWKKCRKKWGKVFLICNYIFEYLYIVLSGSRTGQVTLFIGVLFCLFSALQFKKGKVTVKKTLCNIIISAILPLLLIGSYPVTQTACYSVKSIMSQESSVEEEENKEEEDSFKRLDIEDDVTNQRADIWKDAVNLVWENGKIFGKTNLGYFSYLEEYYPDSFIVQYDKISLHNDWITLLAGSGLAGLSVMVIFCVFVAVRIAKYIFKYRNVKEKLLEIWLPITILLCFLATTLISDAVFLVITTESILFWLFLGYIMYIIDLDKGQKNGSKN